MAADAALIMQRLSHAAFLRIYCKKHSIGLVMAHCANLYYLSSIACMLAECLDERQLEILSSDLSALSEMLESVLIRQYPQTEER